MKIPRQDDPFTFDEVDEDDCVCPHCDSKWDTIECEECGFSPYDYNKYWD